MHNAKVSILIPCYNSEAYLEDCLNSCINQSYKNVEVVIVDDGSLDNSLKIANEYKKRHNNIFIYTQPNQGACKARNLAFEKSHGDYIMYLDADDIISPNKIEAQLNDLSNLSEFDISSCVWDRFHTQTNECIFPQYKCYKNYNSGLDLLVDLWQNGEMFQTSCFLVNRKLIEISGGWEESLKKNQDGEFFARILMQAKSVKFSTSAKVFYRSGEYDSVSKDGSKSKVESLLKSFFLYEKILEFEDSYRTRHALATNFALFRYLYNGRYPDLSDQAKQEIHQLGIKHPIVGTHRVRQISKCIGFENFLKLRKTFINR